MLNYRARFIHVICSILLVAPLLQGCPPSPTQQASVVDKLHRQVWIKYAHVANVTRFQLPNIDLFGPQGSFWAVFDICSIDVQGTALNGFHYDSGRFYISWGAARYGYGSPLPPTSLGNAGSTIPSNSAAAWDAVRTAFFIGPPVQDFQKNLYPNLKYRVAVFVPEYPSGYKSLESLPLAYDGNPEVSAMVTQDGSAGTPAFLDFYRPDMTWAIPRACD